MMDRVRHKREMGWIRERERERGREGGGEEGGGTERERERERTISADHDSPLVLFIQFTQNTPL